MFQGGCKFKEGIILILWLRICTNCFCFEYMDVLSTWSSI